MLINLYCHGAIKLSMTHFLYKREIAMSQFTLVDQITSRETLKISQYQTNVLRNLCKHRVLLILLPRE